MLLHPYGLKRFNENLMKKLTAACLLLSVSPIAMSDGSPWLPGDGTVTISTSLTSGSTSDFFIGDTSTPLGGDIEGTFIWFDASYGYDDIWAFDFRAGYAESSFETNPEEQEDFNDTSFGVSYQFINEFELDNGLPTISGRVGYTIGGDYITNEVDAIGDGASGFDVSLLVGKNVTPAVSLFGDLTYRQRDSDVADGIKALVGVYYTTPVPRLGVSLSAAAIRTDSDINIGDVGVTLDQLPEADKDSDWVILGANYGFDSGIGVGLSYQSVINGKNVPDSDIGTITVSYSF